jgi:hypothetical protein
MREFNYALIRYIADRLRMEPINVGLVLQDSAGAIVKFSPHVAKRAVVDTETYNQWKAFFEAEVKNDVDPLFRPPTNSPEFFVYLSRLCDGPIIMSRPLIVADENEISGEQMLDILFRRLVLPEEKSGTPENQRATGRYRELEAEYQLLKRGVRKHAVVPIETREGGSPVHRRPYRQVANGKYIAMDKIEVARELSRTAEEINGLLNVKSFLDLFLKTQVQQRETRYILLADRLIEPFGGQPREDFQSMRDDIERTVDLVQAAGGEVIRDPLDSEKLARTLNDQLVAAG